MVCLREKAGCTVPLHSEIIAQKKRYEIGPKVVVNTEYFFPHYDLKMKRDTPAQKTFLFLITYSSYNTLPQIFEQSLSLVLSLV